LDLLRHNFATRRIQLWVDKQEDLNVMIPYLSAYMGHAQLSDTTYYIHLLPEHLAKSGSIEWNKLNILIPEVCL